MPAVIYGHKEEAGSLFVNLKEFVKVYSEAGESTVVNLETKDGEKDVLIQEVSYHPVSGDPIHVDFYAIEKGKKVEVDVELEFVGESPAVKGMNGILVKVMHTLPIEAIPKDLPHNIEVDLSTLVDFDSQIVVGDLKLPSGVESMAEAEDVIVLVSEPKEEEEEEVVPDLENIEVEKKGKKEEEGAEGGENSDDKDKKDK